MTEWKLLSESDSWILGGGWKGGVTFGWSLASLVKILENVSETAASWIDQSSSSSQVSSVSAFYVFVLIWRNPRQGRRNYGPYRQTKVDLAWWISCWLWDLTCKYAISLTDTFFEKTKITIVERRGGKLKSCWDISEKRHQHGWNTQFDKSGLLFHLYRLHCRMCPMSQLQELHGLQDHVRPLAAGHRRHLLHHARPRGSGPSDQGSLLWRISYIDLKTVRR